MKICDAHNDFLIEIKNNKEKIKYIKKLNNNKSIKFICGAIWTSKIKNPIPRILNINKFIVSSNYSKKIKLCIEDLGFINKTNLNNSINVLQIIKPIYCGLVWNNDNDLGGGSIGNKKLTNLGKYLIKELESKKIIIDTAHMNNKTFYDFVKITKYPIFNSHTNFNFLKRHKRNLNDKQIKTIINSNGFIGLCFVQDFISDKLIDAGIIAQEIAFFVRKYGDKNIGIGSDFFGTKKLPTNLKSYKGFSLLKKLLKKEGLNRKNINNIFYKNFSNYFKSIKRIK